MVSIIHLLPFLAALSTVLAQSSSVLVWNPAYTASVYDILWGSVLGTSDSETTYTLFCAPQTGPTDCGVDDSVPLTFVEGPSTFHAGTSIGSEFSYTATCAIDSTVSAACSGYTSLASGARFGPLVGPLSTSRTTTLSGSRLEWAYLTLGTPPITSTISGTSITTFFSTTATPSSGITTTSGIVSLPTNTGVSGTGDSSITSTTGPSIPASTTGPVTTSSGDNLIVGAGLGFLVVMMTSVLLL